MSLNTRTIIFRIQCFLKHYAGALTINDLHSPFVYALTEKAFSFKKHYYAFREIETMRRALEQDDTKIHSIQVGAPSSFGNLPETVGELVKRRSSPEKEAQMLFRILLELRPKSILELGTGSGIGTAYLAHACPKARITSIEGDAQVHGLANRNLTKLGVDNVRVIHGDFKTALELFLKQENHFELVLIDGDHQYQNTIEYHRILSESPNPPEVFIFDDIYWSPEMKKAWKEIKAHHSSRVTIDFFDFGLVITNPINPNKKHYKVVPRSWKPWRIGLFQ